MIIYSRFNCEQFVIEDSLKKQCVDVRRASRRMAKLRFDDKWLAERIELFETFTYPSVVAQTDQKFKWIGVVHPDSPQWFLNRLKLYPRMDVRLAERDVEVAVRGEDSVNLDTDDALARDFIREARLIEHRGEINFLRGLRYRILTGNWIGTSRPHGHFNIVKHPELTVLDFHHGNGGEELPLTTVDPRRPMWLEVVHEKNISNKMRANSKDKDLGVGFAEDYFEMAR